MPLSYPCLVFCANSAPDDGVILFIWGNAESCVTIIAASIPILRVFAREVKTRYYTTHGGDTQRDQNGTRRGGGTAQRSRIGGTAKDKLDSDSWSDTSAVMPDAPQIGAPGRIVRTSMVAIEYQDRREGDRVGGGAFDLRY